MWDDYLFVWRDPVTKAKTAYCTACGSERIIDVFMMKTVTDKQYELYTKRHNDYCECPACGTTVQYKDRNRGRGKLWQENYLYFFQKLPGGGAVLRTFYLYADYKDDIAAKISYSEHQRVYYYQGKSYRMKRNVYCYDYSDWYDKTQGGRWDMMCSVKTPVPWTGRMWGCFKGISMWVIENGFFKNGDFRYSCLREYLKSGKDIEYRDAALYTVAEYLALYQKSPSLLEKMMKQGLKPLVHYHLEKQNIRFLLNLNKPNFYEASGLNKAAVKRIISLKDGFEMATQLFVEQMITRYGITAANAEYIDACDFYNGYKIKEWKKIIQNHSADALNKKIKYFRKQRVTRFSDYDDYIKDLKELKMPMTEDNLFPHNFAEAHQALIAEINRRRTAQHAAAARREQKKFKERYEKLLKALFFEDGQYLIRPAKGDAELLEESNVLSHCVYTHYSKRYKSGALVICVIRRKDQPDKPYYTLELTKELNHIVQCRGKGNCGTTAEVEAFKNKWFDWLMNKEEKTCLKTA